MAFNENTRVKTPAILTDETPGAMMLNDNMLNYLEEHLPELMATATKQAYWQTLASGQSVLIAEAGKLVEVFPDGTRTFIKDIAKPTPGVPQEKLRL